MGPPEKRPPLPEWEFALVPGEQRFVSKRFQECNWLQAMEGGIDSSHVSFLHRGDIASDPLFKGAKGNQYNLSDSRPVFEVVESAGGLYIGARRSAENGSYYWRVTQYVLPSFTMIAPRGGHTVHGHFWIPIDDENCWAWSYDYHPTRAISEAERRAMADGKGIHCKYVPGTYRPLANKDNDYLLDRAAQRSGKTYSGVEGIAIQDGSLQESMGPIVDRTKENLVSTDNGIIMARHRLMRAAKELAEKGAEPPGLDVVHQRVRSASLILRPDQHFKDAGKEALKARVGVAPATV
jgi:phenylpropionate dioxygenase-like ring-hydroxylating dioxygenase large terminal subunit